MFLGIGSRKIPQARSPLGCVLSLISGEGRRGFGTGRLRTHRAGAEEEAMKKRVTQTVASPKRFAYGAAGEDHLRMVQREDGRPRRGVEPRDLPNVFRPHAAAAVFLHGGNRAAGARRHSDWPWRGAAASPARPSATALS